MSNVSPSSLFFTTISCATAHNAACRTLSGMSSLSIRDHGGPSIILGRRVIQVFRQLVSSSSSAGFVRLSCLVPDRAHSPRAESIGFHDHFEIDSRAPLAHTAQGGSNRTSDTSYKFQSQGVVER